jgi:Cu(I)/Ag(I) efflux system membrane protein CusA/SilA
MLNAIIRFFLENKLVAVLLLAAMVVWGVASAPFNWQSDWFPRDPVAVDAIPDLGENQQIVFTEWMGRSPQDVEDQITYPLTTALLGVPGVRTIRSSSMLSRSRILEKLSSLPPGTLPPEVQPSLGPDATALGQIFWYTLEGRDSDGNVTGGWDPHELRSLQDYNVRYALSSVPGVAEVASIGGFVKEYQVDINPDAMRAHGVSLPQIMMAVKNSNIDIGAKTIEINRAEYLVRGLGYIESISDLEESVILARNDVPIRIKDVAQVSLGPAVRRGALDKGGAEAVGGVVVARYGANPLEVINSVKEQVKIIAPGLPQKILDDGTLSKVTVVPFYDRSVLIKETLGTLEEALTLEILITIIVIILMVMNLRASMLISGLLPVAVLMCFIAMKYFGVDANIVALSGIAIAIGTMVDMGVVLSENMLRHWDEAGPDENKLEVIYRATTEVAGAVLTAVATTIVSFLPVFTMVAAEGKLFKPLAFTKTFALLAAIIVAITLLPPFAHWMFSLKPAKGLIRIVLNTVAFIAGIVLFFFVSWAGLILIAVGISGLISAGVIPSLKKWDSHIKTFVFALVFTHFLNRHWLPLGPEKSGVINFIFVAVLIILLIGLFYLIIRSYPRILRWCLRNKITFLSIPVVILIIGALSWIGFQGLFGLSNESVSNNLILTKASNIFPGTGKEFMPSLDEGSFLLMPTSMPHSGVEENREIVSQLDMLVSMIPEVDVVVGKLGRVESALDPAPISMFENVINYKQEYISDENGNRLRFAIDGEGNYQRDGTGELIPDEKGKYFRNWRDHIHSPDDIWKEIAAIQLPGVTAAPKLQPIETRLVMLQTGMRAPMGIKIKGPHLDTIQDFGYRLEQILKGVEGVKREAVFADRIVGKPYLEIDLDRKALARYGLTIQAVQHYLETAIGGMVYATTVEGRERYPVRVRYPRELRDDPASLGNILIPASNGTQIPISDVASFNYVQGPQVIKSEDTFLQGYVLFDKLDGYAEVDVVENCQSLLEEQISDSTLVVPAGVSFDFAGSYENQVRAEKRLGIVMPLALFIIFLILYFQFRSVRTSAMIFTSIAVAFGGGFIMIWLYGQGWFLNFEVFGTNLRDLFQMDTINLSVAVWVGFIALFGIATDDGVVLATYLRQTFDKEDPQTIDEVREVVVVAGSRRIRPCLMTTATTLLALLPILSSTGRGSDIMLPMAIPSFGGMAIELITLFVIPVLYSIWKERDVKRMIINS